MLLETEQTLSSLLKEARDTLQKESWADSEALLTKALAQAKNLQHLICLERGDVQLQQNKPTEAARSYLQAYRIAGRLNADTAISYRKLIKARTKAMSFNPRAYLVNDLKKIIYCKIPKNACTVFTNMMVEHSSISEAFGASPLGPHDFLSENQQALRIEDPNVLQNSDYFKFVVIRNPFKRLVSGYLDKFAKTTLLEKMAKEVVINVQRYIGIDRNLERSITFDEFIRYLARTEDYSMDAHWRPQNTFLDQGLFEFDWIGQFENLGDTIATLERKFGFSISQSVMKKAKRGHATQYSDVAIPENPHTMLPEQLRGLSGFPKADQLFVPELKKLISKRYAEDIKNYRQRFGPVEI